ncbi:Uncharacterised protein [Avibacterium paragallinarum]|uniref:Uncharacterized protein n=1 Tax=Avibacterium paragallinarum TaxID=728 RepID=A0A377ICI1_AVIPA|nr:Uncharacterised protein [Avibacterium paragallinarum]
MRKVRSKPDDYFPSVGKFISWCKQDRFEALGLPNEDELYDRLKKFKVTECWKFTNSTLRAMRNIGADGFVLQQPRSHGKKNCAKQ